MAKAIYVQEGVNVDTSIPALPPSPMVTSSYMVTDSLLLPARYPPER